MSRNGRSTTKSATRKATKPKQLKIRKPTAARIKAQLEFLKQLQREKEEYWASLTPAQQREELEKWERVKKSINETRGYRKVFVE